ncbi:hypothetical protein SETIT_1G168200v2 [Setaria italica]|uniref:Uncharacterized protein n=1 Tax=Setaria italica TaxID=4555 RepID=A0A368PL47_SETIT|nr:hypothetical protein SETIT_1G168200v2 [Setaria italica]
MAVRRHPPSLAALPTKVAIEIAGDLTVTLERPMDDHCSLRATCSFMRYVCGDRTIGRCLAIDQFRLTMSLNEPVNYGTLLASLTQVSFLTGIKVIFGENRSTRPCLDDLARAAAGGHKVAAYLVTLFLYRDNGGTGDDDTARRYMTKVEGEKE